MLQGCHRFLLMDVYAAVLLQDLGGLQGCNQTTKFSINIFSDLGLGFFYLLLLLVVLLYVTIL